VAYILATMVSSASASERQRAIEICQSVLEGCTSVLEAVRLLFPLAHTNAISEKEDRILIIAIESETDDLPVGEVRKLWAPDALKVKDLEIARAQARWGPQFLEACRRIVRKNRN
jgi:hypothetical protein